MRSAVEQLANTVNITAQSLDTCFVITYEQRNNLMEKISRLRDQTGRFGCAYLQELTSLTEIITMLVFRSTRYHDHQGLAHIEDAVQQMRACCVTNSAAEGQRMSIAATIERLWRWVDTNTANGQRIIE